MAIDAFPGSNKLTLEGPAHAWKVVTPHDTNALAGGVPKAIHIGGGAVTSGSIVCIDGDGNTATFFANQGDTLAIRPHIIKSTGTTASLNIIALY